MVGLVIVSHSARIAEGICELARQMASPDLKLIPAGGMEDGQIGTDAFRIQAAIEEADSGDGVLILCDLGSAVMSTETALEFLEDPGLHAEIADTPIVEGSIAAAVIASTGAPFEEVKAAAMEARTMHKL
ncbi:MAG: dihydroxyacetone kinase phosphoryl donor subunit DhaM [Lachnospiraceae bacterium]